MCDVMMSCVMSCVMMSQDGDVICGDVTGWWQHWSVSQQGELYICVRNLLINGIQWILCAILHVVLLIKIFCNKTIKSV